ncbi:MULTISPECIES: flagellar hook-associated protein FlgK [unclassified Gilliamella]|uniref:flagellar hook-associated protein FlgK n=1 Tax=unclassified Gilliamella TaxID=2685620 RepID=UPI002269EB05|nr:MULTISPECIES: flagellar hook-associated protein FlgK [unclassified Gilliamella]MCX8601741.1 flagellar hook-associated protein FlgK [Gilliamella sp. B3722]MCX8608399.1 flagellar hook-associated protein FlgK [Gilliamella sp. B3771]MCX8611004.1 flagellar hook-associated protein FlgK [Gilliamella sp. B3891]MCX8613472.1 flagellar hook-associated protein FlgK [Gilliamella sp. B3773]MCX8616386.1 flagellar hook-associated protein FlgK [Gilliamella sp. B3770]
MSNSLMNTGISGLNAAQNMLNVISNNISNAHTTGYNRQQQILQQANSSKYNFGFVGNGVSVNSVNRAFNQFVVGQLRQSQSQNGSIKAYYNELSKVDNLLAENDNSISSQLNNLFASLNKLTTNAGDASSKQTVISNLTSLVSQFNKTEMSLKNQIANINTELSNNVDQINAYTKQIAELNQKISKLQAVSGGNEPNALLDERDQLVNELSEIVGINVTEQNGQYNISLANGLNLVQGSTVNTLSVQPSKDDPSLNAIVYTHNSGATQELTSQNIASGRINGLLAFRDGPLSESRNQLGLIALNLAERFNQVQMSGVDINGDQGEKLLDYQKPSSIANTKNQGNASVNIDYQSVNDVKASDYKIEYNGSDWVVTRLSDNTQITPQLEEGKLIFDGLSIEITGNAVSGDSFMLKPVADIASSLQLLVKDVNKLATGIADDENGSGDNRNVAKFLEIQNEKLINGTKTLNSAYTSLVSYIGSETHTAKISAQSSQNITQQIYEQNQSISGVNIEEEYISMQVYMQYYQANAKVIDAATTIFDTILGLAK